MKLKSAILVIIFMFFSILGLAEELQQVVQSLPQETRLSGVAPAQTIQQSSEIAQDNISIIEPVEQVTHENAVASFKINKITIAGNDRTEDSTILSYISLHAGGHYTQARSEESLRSLYATGLFSQVNILYKNSNIIIQVIENPVISKIVFEGNDAIKSDTLLSEISLKPRMVLSKTKIQSDTNRIVEIYSKTGRFNVVVKPQIIEMDQNRVNLIFEIKEGKKAKISKILFIGNKHFSNSKLQSVMMSKEYKFYSFFAKTDHYDSDLVEYDKLLLTRFYNSQGYAHFKIISSTADIVPVRNTFYLTFSVEEGEKYKFGSMDVESKIPQVDIDSLRKAIQTKQNEIFDSSLIESTTEAMIKILSNHGYPFVSIDPVYSVDDVNKTIAINYVVGQARQVYIGKINIKGNLKTYDEVIRREFKIAEGDPYNEFLINRSEQQINNLNFFEKVSVKTERTNRPDVINIDVDVTEKSTASLKFSVGYSTTDGVFGMIGLTEKNFAGTGQEVSAGITKSATTLGANVGFVEPYFMDQNLSAGFSLFANKVNNKKSNWGAHTNTLAYDTASVGGTVNFGYNIADYLSHEFGYTLERDKISGVQSNAPPYIQEQVGENYASILNQGLIYDRTDNQIIPRKGYILKLNQNLAGLGGDSKYIKHVFAASYYQPVIKDKVIVKVAGSTGSINSFGRAVRINENFYLGDSGFRGFEYGGIGPRDKKTRDALGGTLFYKGTAEITFPLGLPEEFDVSGAVFSDVGSVWNVDRPKNSTYSKDQYYDSKSLRVTGGVGFLWITKMGPLRIDFAKAIKKQSYDQTQLVHFSFSTNF